MSTYVLSIDKNKKPKDLLKFLDEHNLQKGDKVTLVSESNSVNTVAMFAVIALLTAAFGLYFYRKKKQDDDTERILDDLFKDYSTVEEYEAYIKKEFGITVEHEEQDEDWHALSTLSLKNAYDEDEPDISDIEVKEPNPLYKPL